MIWTLLILLTALGISNLQNLQAPGSAILANRGGLPADERLAHVARRYAPFIYHAAHPTRGRQDVISNIDFDGDWTGNNNWENFERYQLRPTVYYAVLETATHYFIAYHLFHPRDWNRFTVWLNDTHENDGENLQVVVRKSDGRVVLLWTQAHYRSRVYAVLGSGIASGAEKIAGSFDTVDSRGVPVEGAPHAAVFVEAYGHGIYGTRDGASQLTLAPDGAYRFRNGSGLLFRPARPGEAVAEPQRYDHGEVPYMLDSLTVKLWPGVRDGTLVGDGRLLDRPYPYRDQRVRVGVPRYYDGDRFSGPLGPDRGISPFALDFHFRRGTLGALFFDPARRYAERLTITGAWSREYVEYPFSTATGEPAPAARR